MGFQCGRRKAWTWCIIWCPNLGLELFEREFALALQPHMHVHTHTHCSPQLEEELRDRTIVDVVKSTQRKPYRTDGKCPTMLGPEHSDMDLPLNGEP